MTPSESKGPRARPWPRARRTDSCATRLRTSIAGGPVCHLDQSSSWPTPQLSWPQTHRSSCDCTGPGTWCHPGLPDPGSKRPARLGS
eukprot:12392066-Alexandrium_andersonii.AAC.1